MLFYALNEDIGKWRFQKIKENIQEASDVKKLMKRDVKKLRIVLCMEASKTASVYSSLRIYSCSRKGHLMYKEKKNKYLRFGKLEDVFIL